MLDFIPFPCRTEVVKVLKFMYKCQIIVEKKEMPYYNTCVAIETISCFNDIRIFYSRVVR